MTWASLAGLVRQHFPGSESFSLAQNLSCVKQLVRKRGLQEALECVEGAHLAGCRDLRVLNSAGGEGYRWARAVYWSHQAHKPWKVPQPLKDILRSVGS
jgi:hypothetical protein